MNESGLHTFMVVFQIRSISKAADVLHISRQGLSKALKNMENDLDKQLFVRKNDGLHPTEAGYELAIHAQIILDEYKKIHKENALDQFEEKRLRICGFDAVAELFDVSFFKEFEKNFRNIIISIEELTETQARDRLYMKQCDFAIVTNAVDISDFEADEIFRAQYGVLVNRRHAFAKKKVVSFNDLEGEKIIGKPLSLSYYYKDTNYIMKQNIKLDVIIELTNTGMIRKLVSEDVGIALAWDYNFGRDIYKNVVFRPLLESGWGRTAYLISNREGESNTQEQLRLKKFIINWLKRKKQNLSS